MVEVTKLPIQYYVKEGYKYIIKGREADWRKFCNENFEDIYLIEEVFYTLQSLNHNDCDYQNIFEQLQENSRDKFTSNYIENMIVKYSFRGYEFVTKTCNLDEDRKRIIDKIEKSNGKYKNKSRY